MKSLWTAITASAALAVASSAQAHISIASGPAYADTTQEVSLSVGHGCEGSDTYRVRVVIPSGVTSVRPAANPFGRLSVEKDGAGVVTAVVWQKADADVLAADDAYYKLAIRLRAPNAPFTTTYFKISQTCKSGTGTLSTTEWVALPGEAGEPAAALNVLPARKPGWNKYVVPRALTADELKTYFADALIVWKGDSAAFSINPETIAQISATGAATLDSLAANDEIWVRY